MNIKDSAREFFSREDIRAQALSDLAEIISIPSVASEREGDYPYGAECAGALDKASELAEKYGFRVENHEYHCMSVLYGDSDKEVGIVCHLDVVPAGDGWSVPPYELTVDGDLLMGRGTHDDKGPFIQSLYTLRFFKECNIELPFTVRLILGSDEEVGSSDLEYFVTVRKPPIFSFTPDSEFPVCIGEKSILGVEIDFGTLPESIESISGGTVSNAVAGFAKASIITDKALSDDGDITVTKTETGYTVESVGKAAHAAMPESGVNAIGNLVGYLLKNGIIAGERFEILENATCEYLGETLGINASNADFGYVTCVGGVIETRDGRIVQSFNIRHLPENEPSELVLAMEKAVSSFGGSVKSVSESKGYFVSADDDKIRALTSACESVLGIECKPYTMGGGTYARWLPNTVAFGSGIESERGYLGSERGNAHQRDEYISKRELFDGMEVYSLAIGNLRGII